MNSDLFTISSLMSAVSTLTDPTSDGLLAKLNTAATNWYNGQISILSSRKNQYEKEAYAVSDLIAPQYAYQNCGRY